MVFKVNDPSFKKLYSNNPDFLFCPDGLHLVPRADLEILPECPRAVRDQIHYALAKGWLQPVAHMKNEEYMWEKLAK